MKNLRHIYRFVLIFLFGAMINTLISCSDDNPISKIDPSREINKNEENKNPTSPSTDEPEVLTDLETMLVDYMAIGALENYYLWIDDPGRKDMVEAYLNPDTCMHPKIVLNKVLSTEDRWTALMDNFSETLDRLDGIETTIGADFTPYLIVNDQIIFVINYVYNNSPAQQAGIKRGDIILEVNGKIYDKTNYQEFYKQNNTLKISLGKFETNKIVKTGVTVDVTPVKMDLDPILCYSVFDLGTKKVGYLAYDNFTADIENLKKVLGSFKEQQVSEIVLDLRYNSGGYILTSKALASMLAPVKDVENEEIYHKNIYNSLLTEVFKNTLEDTFDKNYVEYNPDLKKIYALVSRYTASASEGLLVGLSPYIDISIIGEQTHGKFCSAVMLNAQDIFEKDFYEEYKSEFKDWGIYVMIGTFADKNGKNASRPNGFIPDIEAEDYPIDGYQLGDENESMLRVALELAGKVYPKSETRAVHSRPDMKSIFVERNSICLDSHSANASLNKVLLPKFNPISNRK